MSIGATEKSKKKSLKTSSSPWRWKFSNAHLLFLKVLIPQTLTMMETELASLKEENYKLKRQVSHLQKHSKHIRTPQDMWTTEDWDKAYGSTDD